MNDGQPRLVLYSIGTGVYSSIAMCCSVGRPTTGCRVVARQSPVPSPQSSVFDLRPLRLTNNDILQEAERTSAAWNDRTVPRYVGSIQQDRTEGGRGRCCNEEARFGEGQGLWARVDGVVSIK